MKILNVFVMVASVFMLFGGYELLTNYFMSKNYFSGSELDFWALYCLPLILMSVGATTLIVSIVGFICSIFESKHTVIGYAIVMILIVLGNFGCIFVTFKAAELIGAGLSNTTISDPHFEVMRMYHHDKDFRSSWDKLQSKLRCCGGNSYKDFYHNTTSNCFPSSCQIFDNEKKNETCLKKVSYLIIRTVT